MKKIIVFSVTMIVTIISFAQMQLATLKHNDNISAFYGADALKNAHNSAVNGDIITLSPGSFNAVNITKAVTIRGAGMFIDTVAGTRPTHINGNFSIDIPNDSIYHLTLEGLYIPSSLSARRSYYAQIIKCRIHQILNTMSSDHFNNTTIINCIIDKMESYTVNSQVINSVILEFYNANDTYLTSFYNCIVKGESSTITHNAFHNSILYHNVGGSTTPYSSYNCIGIGTNTFIYFKSPLLNGCKNYSSFSAVFKDFDGTYINGETTFELQDSIANTMLGLDGTQVGIYGGYMPFDARVSNPIIRKINVANRSTADGKLSVDIEVVSE